MAIAMVGTALGLAVAAACVAFYRKGVKDGGGFAAARGGAPKQGADKPAADEGEAAMMRRYETILSYDPYNLSREAGPFEGRCGERV